MRFNEFQQPIEEGVNDPHIFKAVFMAGSPGAGKTTVSKQLLSGGGLKNLNVDDFYNYLRAAKKTTGDTDQDYNAAWEKYRVREENFLSGRLGLIIDGTGKNPTVMQNVKINLEMLGYETAMVFVNTSLKTAMQRAEMRARQPGPDFGREIDATFVKQTWLKVQKGIGQLQSIFGPRFYIIDNNGGTPDTEYVQKSLAKWLNAPPATHTAKEWMRREQEAKTQPR